MTEVSSQTVSAPQPGLLPNSSSWCHGTPTNIFLPEVKASENGKISQNCPLSWLSLNGQDRQNDSRLHHQAVIAEAAALCQSLLSAATIATATPTTEVQSSPSMEVPKQLLELNQPTIVTHTPESHEFVMPTPKAPVAAHMHPLTAHKTTPGLQHKRELFVPNDLIGCIIGRGGNKINEIRQTSQANIKISSGEEGEVDRRITITGTHSAVQTADRLINNSIDLHKHLIALNMAMNTVYATRQSLQAQKDYCPSVSRHELLMGKEQVNNQHDSPVNICRFTSSSPVHGRLPSSAPARLGPGPDDQDSGSFVTQRGLRVGSICQTPRIPIPLLSADQLKAANTTPFDANTDEHDNDNSTESLDNNTNEHVDINQVMDLIKQLPKEDQHKWLVAFGLIRVGEQTHQK